MEMERQTSTDDATLRHVLDSAAFRKAPALRTLVEYLWLHRDEELNEFRIATEALGRRSDFNPKTDSAVRVQLLRVRQKLKEFYAEEGKDTAQRIALPPGSNRLQLESVPLETPDAAEAPRRRAAWAVAAASALLAVAAFAWGWNRHGEAQAGSALPLPDFWAGFTSNRKPVRLVLPNIAFFRWPNNTIKVRDTRVNRFDQLPLSAELTEFSRRWGTPEIMVNYTAAPDAVAASEIAILLSRHSVAASLVGARDAALDPPGAYNRVLLGNGRTGGHILAYLAGLNFDPTDDFGFVNRAPQGSEPARFDRVEESRRREMVPGLICRKPAAEGEARTLILLSENNPALARLLVTAAGLADLGAALDRAGAREGFEAVAVAEIETARVASVKIAAVRKVPPSR